MKVYEIISENQVDEAWYTDLANRAISKVVGKFGSKLMNKSDFIEHEAGVIANLAKSKGISIADAVAQNNIAKTRAVEKYVADAVDAAKRAKKPVPNMTELQKEAEAAVGVHPLSKDPSVQQKIISKAESAHGASIVGKVGEVGAKGWAIGMLGLKSWGLYEMWWPPYKDYKEAMENAKANLDSGKWDQAKFNYVENQQLSTLIGRWGAALLISSVPAMLINNKLTRGILGKHLGGVLDLTTTGAVIALRNWLNRDDNADSIAAIMMNDYVAGNGEVMGNQIPGLGSIAAAAKHKITGEITADPTNAQPQTGAGQGTAQQGTTNPGAQTGTAAPNARQDISSTSITPADHGDAPTPNATAMGRKMWSNDPLAINNYDITGWKSMPGKPGFIQDPNNPANFLPKPSGWQP